MRPVKFILLLVTVIFLSSCYHAQIFTEAEPSGQVIDEPWAHSFIFGLVPPKEIRTASECPNGVAKVETQISFLNGLVSAITFQIYTPMHITVTCAAGRGMSTAESNFNESITVSRDADDADVIEAIQEASNKAVEFKKPVFVKFQ